MLPNVVGRWRSLPTLEHETLTLKINLIYHENGNDANPLSAGLSTLKGYYIIGNRISRTGGCQTETISFQRKNAIGKFVKDTSMTWKE